MDTAIGRPLQSGTYYEKHHVLPKCMGGGNEKENLVMLTAREHFLSHWLLTRINPKNKGLAWAFWCMCNVRHKNQVRHIPTSRVYSEAKELLRSLPINEETRRKMSEASKGRIPNEAARIKMSSWVRREETKQRIRDANIGKTHSDETRKKMSDSQKNQSEEIKQKIRDGNKTRVISETTRQKLKNRGVSEATKLKISEAMKGMVRSEDTRNKISEAKKNQSEETRKKIAIANTGRTHSLESRTKMSEARKRYFAKETKLQKSA